MTVHSTPNLIEAQLHQLTARLLSPASRYGHVALLIAALLMCVLLSSLLLTEANLPARTSFAFSVMLGIGVSWVAYACWVLRYRRPLLGMHRVVAAWMALVFTALFLAGAIAMLLGSGGLSYRPAVFAGGCLFALALVLLFRARAQVARLRAQRAELERQLHG